MALSPMMNHYLRIKEDYKDAIVFYRLGDFYEMFFDDAIKASSLLELTLTGRDCGLEERAPMCGIPYHAADIYIAKLVNLGEKVAICEQLTEPNGKSLVEREVIRVVTAGTLIDDNLINEKTNNFVGCVYKKGQECSFAWADITTGEFFTQVFTKGSSLNDILDVLIKVAPVEIISNNEAFEAFKNISLIKHDVLPKFSCYNEWAFNIINAEKALKEQLKVLSLSAFNLISGDISIVPAGALIAYLKETQKHSLQNINKIKLESTSEYMTLDANAIRNLELIKTIGENKRYGSVLWLLDKTKTNMGARTLQNWILSPLQNIKEINYRLDGVEELYKNILVRQGLTDLFKSVKDIGRLTGKISNGNLLPRDCVALANSLEVLPSLKFELSGLNSPIIIDSLQNIQNFTQITKLLKTAIEELPSLNLKDGGYIKEGYNAQLDEYRSLSKNSKDVIANLEQRERVQTGIKNLKIGFNRVFGYYIEVTNSFKEKVPYSYQRKQTLANAERYITDELKELEEKILSSEDKALKLETELFNEIRQILLKQIEPFQSTSSAIGVLDVLNSLATVAKQNGYQRPILVENDQELNIIDGRHPVVEAIINEQFIANDTILDTAENRTMIITGPNMAGKSTYMRQVALIVLMAHIGSFVPAKQANIPIVDRIFTRVGASDNLILDQSTFMVEMTEVANILLNATKKSLLILDEIGRGTSTFDGLSIAWSVVEYLTNTIKAKTLFATHYHELTELEGLLDGVKNYKVTIKELNNSIVFLRKIMRGGANKSFGIEVASLAGVPKSITDRAKIILKNLEKNDITIKNNAFNDVLEQKSTSEIENIISELNFDNITPMQAFNILQDLGEKVKK